MFVWAALNIAQSIGVSDLMVGLTIVALGTSLPELAASMGSALKGEDDLAVGNVIGSNVYILLAVYSLLALIASGEVEATLISHDFPVLLAFIAALFILAFLRRERLTIGKLQGCFLPICIISGLFIKVLFRYIVCE